MSAAAIKSAVTGNARQICLQPSTIPGHGCLMRSITGGADGNEHRNCRDK
ncbi:MAG TPA: hypothetical protein VHB01_05185 [Nitrosospira sp.]|nr:hypothetical protein [Nitrosospira sp.]